MAEHAQFVAQRRQLHAIPALINIDLMLNHILFEDHQVLQLLSYGFAAAGRLFVLLVGQRRIRAPHFDVVFSDDQLSLFVGLLLDALKLICLLLELSDHPVKLIHRLLGQRFVDLSAGSRSTLLLVNEQTRHVAELQNVLNDCLPGREDLDRLVVIEVKPLLQI